MICDEIDTPGDEEVSVPMPRLIVEVLSDRTEAIGRGDTFAACQTLPSCEEYLLVSAPPGGGMLPSRPFAEQVPDDASGESDYDRPGDLREFLGTELSHERLLREYQFHQAYQAQHGDCHVATEAILRVPGVGHRLRRGRDQVLRDQLQLFGLLGAHPLGRATVFTAPSPRLSWRL